MKTNHLTSDVATAIRHYAANVRTDLNTHEASAVSYAGLWLLLASLAPAVTDADRFRDVCGLPPEGAKQAATRLFEEPHPTVALALGAWLRQDVVLPRGLPVAVEPLPNQGALDDWVRRETGGVLNKFPLALDPDTMLVLATALVVTPRWSSRLNHDEYDDMLVLRDGF